MQREQSGHIGLGLFQRGILLLQFHPRIRFPSADRDLVRAQPVTKLVRYDVREEKLETQILLRRWHQHNFRNRHQRRFEFRFLHILQHHPLAAFLLHHFVVVGQIVGRGLHPVCAVARAEHFVHHSNWSRRPQFGHAILRILRQIIFDVLQVAPQKS